MNKKVRIYDKEFKLDAIALYKRSGRPRQTIAEELGIARSTFNKWVNTFDQEGEQSFPGKGHLSYEKEELLALRKELHHVKQERDILKKAVAIFSIPSGKGMNS